MQHQSHSPSPFRRVVGAVAVAVMLTLAGCGGGSGSSSGGTTTTASGAGRGDPVLPVTENPIANTATAETLTIDSVLVENNEDDAGNAVDDHLEIALTNTGTTDLAGFEAFYTFTDPTADEAESYYADLAGFSIPAGESRTVHFDSTGATDHYPDNEFSLFHSSQNALDVEVEVSAEGSAPQTGSVQKDAGGDEVPD